MGPQAGGFLQCTVIASGESGPVVVALQNGGAGWRIADCQQCIPALCLAIGNDGQFPDVVGQGRVVVGVCIGEDLLCRQLGQGCAQTVELQILCQRMIIIQFGFEPGQGFPVIIAGGIQCPVECACLGRGQCGQQATGNQYCGANHLSLHVSRQSWAGFV